MRSLRTIGIATLAAASTAAGMAAASGGPPPAEPPAPAPDTVVARGSAESRVAEPARRTNRTVERSVREARGRAIPRAFAAARAEAAQLAAAAGLRLGDAVGIARDVGPAGWYDADSGRFGPGRWCGPLVTWRAVRRADGSVRRVRRSRRGCVKPATASVRVTVTFAAARSR
jgi:hypothetical protein